jgi:ankyrin repeat protein
MFYINQKGSNERNALHLACEKGHLTIVKCLIANGIDINQQDVEQSNALHIALEYHQKDIAQFLIENGIDIKKLIPTVVACFIMHQAMGLRILRL